MLVKNALIHVNGAAYAGASGRILVFPLRQKARKVCSGALAVT